MLEKIKNFLKDESGQGQVELAIVGGLIAAAAALLGMYLIPNVKAANRRLEEELRKEGILEHVR